MCGHHRAYAVIIDADDPRTSGGGVPVRFLH
jgi:hypothetical protein